MASSPQQFIDRAINAGYTKEEIAAFLRQSGSMQNKERQALEILSRQGANPDPESQRIAGEATGELGGSDIMGTLGTVAKTAVPLAVGAAAGAPLLAAAGEALGGLGAAGAAGAGAAEAAGAGGIGAALGSVLSRPTGKDAVSLFNTFRKRGAGHALAQLGSQQAKKFSQQAGAAGLGAAAAGAVQPQQGEIQRQPVEAVAQEALAPQTAELPQPLAQLAIQEFENFQDPVRAGQQVAMLALGEGHPLRNLARSFERQSGNTVENAVADFLAGQFGQQQGEQMAAQGAEIPESDLSQLSDSELMALAQKMGIV